MITKTNVLKSAAGIAVVALTASAATYTVVRETAQSTITADSQFVDKIAVLERKIASLSPERVPDTQVNDQIALLQSQIAGLEGRLSRQSHRENNAPDETANDEPVVTEPQLSYEEMMEREAERASAQEALVTSTFLEEETDPVWSVSATTLIEESFNKPELAGGQLANVECHTQTCLVEFDLGDAESISKNATYEDDFLASIGEQFSSGTIKATTDESGSVHYTVYLAKNGHELPNIDAVPGGGGVGKSDTP